MPETQSPAYVTPAEVAAPTSRATSLPDALKHFDSLPNAASVRQPVVEALFACWSATVWRRVKDGRIPRPRKLSDRVTTWNVGELRAALIGRT